MQRRAFVFGLLGLMSAEAAARCGSRGGPGLRLENGRCASWADVQRGKTGAYEGGGIAPTVPRQPTYPSTAEPARSADAAPGHVSSVPVQMRCTPVAGGKFLCEP
jgi:hypothetical protein